MLPQINKCAAKKEFCLIGSSMFLTTMHHYHSPRMCQKYLTIPPDFVNFSVVWFQVFLSNTNHFDMIIWFEVIIPI